MELPSHSSWSLQWAHVQPFRWASDWALLGQMNRMTFCYRVSLMCFPTLLRKIEAVCSFLGQVWSYFTANKQPF